MDKEDNRDFLEHAQKEQKELDESMKESFRQRDERKQADKKKISEGYKKLAEVTKQVGNLQVQNTDYQQIVQELSDKLKQYENKYGTVFTKGSSNKTE
jgi:FixJ family two-component response regulator